MARRFLLIDRDGTLIVEKGYLSDPEQIELIPCSGEALQTAQQAGYGLCVISNQSGIARGYFDVSRLDLVHARLMQELLAYQVRLDGIFYCPHGPEDLCDCRKPLPGLAKKAALELDFEPSHCWVVGDKDVDIGLAHALEARSVLVRTGYGRDFAARTTADFVADDLQSAIGLILREDGGSAYY